MNSSRQDFQKEDMKTAIQVQVPTELLGNHHLHQQVQLISTANELLPNNGIIIKETNIISIINY